MENQQIDPIQVSNNLSASSLKNVNNLAGLLDQVVAQHPEKDQITRISNDLVANISKQISSLGNVIETLTNQIMILQNPVKEQDKFQEPNAQTSIV